MDRSKTLVITGGNKGMGKEIARYFHKKGYNVFIGARTDNGVAEELGEGTFFVMTDVTKEEDLERLAATAAEKTGKIDVFINCAGFSRWSAVQDVSEEFWDKMINTNLKGTFFGCKVASEYLGEGGSIINLSSIAGKRGSANNSVYCASKFGVSGITQALAKELGIRGIRVNAVCPVYITTEGLIEALKEPCSPACGTETVIYLESFASKDTALKRLPTAEEVAKMCLFLASDEASAITGQCINVDCGVFPQ
ncbi:MAG: SDR family oxidoreductase [Methanomicrobiaceae archaeon]|nr:SDR family oxidoreductase [Methanomicrobiaceae archaeon]